MGFAINLADEYLHMPTDQPYWRESLWLDAYDMSQDVGIVVYMHSRSGHRRGDVVVYATHAGQESQRLEAWDIPCSAVHVSDNQNGLTLANIDFRVTRPGSAVRVTADTPALMFDLAFDAYGPIFDYDWVDWTNSHHYEQFGRVTGKIRMAARELQFIGSGTRDHAWGTRGQVNWQGWLWVTARFPTRAAWSICFMRADSTQLFAYLLNETAHELDWATAEIRWEATSLIEAKIAGSAKGHTIDARIYPIASIDLSGRDPTKRGTYLYYFIQVEDATLGRGVGLLDIFAPLGYPVHFAAR
jgi:hypothetical protein